MKPVKPVKHVKPTYWCIKVDPDVINQILPSNDVHHLKIQHQFHLTLLYNKAEPSEETLLKYTPIVGKQISLKILGYVTDSKGGAFLVEKTFEHADLCTNICPHISIGNIEGQKPFYNSSLCERIFLQRNLIPFQEHEKLVLYDEPKIVNGIVCFI